MAVQKTRFLTNDALTRKKWARELHRILLTSIEFNDLIGTGSSAIVELKNDLGKGEGDNITFGIRLPLTGEGVVGDDAVEGNEEKLSFRNFACTIEELNHAVDTGGKMEEQRVPYDLMVEGKDALQYWWGDKLSDLMFAHLCGDTTFQIAGKTFAQDPTDPDSDHLIVMNDATEGSITSADVMDLTLLDRMKQRAELPTGGAEGYKVRPIKINGKNFYRVILHNYVFDLLRQNTNVGQWGDLLRNANKLQMANVEIEYNGMLISKSERIRTTGTANEYRNVLLGSQAAVVAWGGAGESKSTTMAFVPYSKDAKRFMMVRGGGILGIKKTVFQSQDFGIIVGSSYATAIS